MSIRPENEDKTGQPSAAELRGSAEQGNANAQYWLGGMYQNGQGVPQDDAEALNWYLKSAEQGNAHAQFELGWMYSNGKGVPQDNDEAKKWYRKAAEQGNANAQYWLGRMYQNGQGVPQDDNEAIKWYRKAAEQGDVVAQNSLGWMYINGKGVPQDNDEALSWYRTAAEKGYSIAQYNLGEMYYHGYGVEEDNDKAMEWYQNAAEQGHVESQYRLGEMYYHRYGVDDDEGEFDKAIKDIDKAINWYQNAAEWGHVESQYRLGEIYYYGYGFNENIDKAMEWYQKAAEQGHASAQGQLGFIYSQGKGVSQDYIKAVKLFHKAAKQGNSYAQNNLGVMYENGTGVRQSDTEAAKWYLKAAEQGNESGQANLGRMYEKGRGVPQNNNEAVKWFQRAAEQGNASAEEHLAQMKAKGIEIDTAEDEPLLDKIIDSTGSDSEGKKQRAFVRSPTDVGECKALFDACTPQLYLHNAFRISGIPVDASTRDIKRRIDDLKAAAEMGDLKGELIHAFALEPTPSFDQIRETSQRLQEPEQRIIDEFFWFWPDEFGKSNNDSALRALRNCDYGSAFRIWSDAQSDGHSPRTVVAKHNLAVMYHLKALDAEQNALQSNLSDEQLLAISKDWRTCFKWWGELAEDETLWSLVANRIRMFDDPRITTGFARRMRATLPEAINKINALLAIAFAEFDKMFQATIHLNYMKETHLGKDNVPRTLSIITKPYKERVTSAIEKATSMTQKQPDQGAKEAKELLQAISKPLIVIQTIIPPEDHERIDISDAVAEACLTCQIAYARVSGDWTTSLEIVDNALKYAASEETVNRLADKRSELLISKYLDPIYDFCKKVSENVENSPNSGYQEAHRVIQEAPQFISKLSSANVPNEILLLGKDQLALILDHCAVIFGNKNEKWKPCLKIFEEALKYASSQEVKSRIEKNLSTAKKNEIMDDLSPISSAPSLSTINGVGFQLYGSTDFDRETGSYLSTYYFVLLFIPIFPIRRYRVISTGNGYRFLGQSPLRALDKWHIFIALALLAFFAINIIRGSNSSPTYQSSSSSSTRVSDPSPPQSYSNNNSTRSALLQEIGDRKIKVQQMEEQIKEMDGRLDDYQQRMRLYKNSGMEDDYNALVPSFNSLVSERDHLYQKYKRMIDEINTEVGLYNMGNR